MTGSRPGSAVALRAWGEGREPGAAEEMVGKGGAFLRVLDIRPIGNTLKNGKGCTLQRDTGGQVPSEHWKCMSGG